MEASLGSLEKVHFFQLLDWGKETGPIHRYLAQLYHLPCQPFIAIHGAHHHCKRCVAGWISWHCVGSYWNRKQFFRATPNAGDGESWRVSFMVDHHKQRENCTSCFGRKKSYMVVSWNRAAFALLALKKVVTCFCTHKLYTLRHIVPQICVPVWNGIILNNISMDLLCSCIFLNIYLAAQGAAITVCYLLLTWKTL